MNLSLDLLLIDVDGVLTDGVLTIDHRGEKLFKRFHTRDVRAIREFVAHGWEVVLVSADDWPGIHAYAEKVGAEVYVAKDKDDLPYDRPFVAVGDDAWDVPMLRRAAIAYCPSDADCSVMLLQGIRMLETRGGRGVVAELARRLLS